MLYPLSYEGNEGEGCAVCCANYADEPHLGCLEASRVPLGAFLGAIGG